MNKMTCREKILSQDYWDFILPGDRGKMADNIPENSYCRQQMDFGYESVSVDKSLLSPLNIEEYWYNSIPNCYTLLDSTGTNNDALNSAGILQVQNYPTLRLMGEGVMIGFLDTGIDYRNPVFQNIDGSTRIAGLWDQTIQTGNAPKAFDYGSEYREEMLNEALRSEDPLSIVPTTDTNGHGTYLASIAAGNADVNTQFLGAAPEAILGIVKLKEAKNYLRDFYLIREDAVCYQENDIMLGIAFAVRMARKMGMPVSVCLGLGTSQGAHIGDSELSRYLNYINEDSNVSVSVAAGNEGVAQHHFTADLSVENSQETAELRVAEGEEGFYMEFWGNPPDEYSISVQSPIGEILYVSSSLGAGTQQLFFIFTETRVLVNYVGMERTTGKQLVYFRFFHPAPGIWKIHVTRQEGSGSRFHMWLPVQGLISADTYFLQSTPYNTVTAPGDSVRSITATAYQYRDNSLFYQAGRGFTPDNQVTPDLAAPGVNLLIPLRGGGFGTGSGSSLAAAITAGAAALMLEWAIVRGNIPYASGNIVKYALQKGADRDENVNYPNPGWGYGRLDLYHTFEILK